MSTWPARLDHFTTTTLKAFLAEAQAPVVLWPLGSVEPHGPHLPLATDALISEENARRALVRLRAAGVEAVIAPTMPYGVTDFAAGFPGAVSMPEGALVAILCAGAQAWLAEGFRHVALINHHLEPGQLAAVAKAQRQIAEAHGAASVSAPAVVSGRWGRRLTEEFRQGACHAGQYETSMILASDGELVRDTEGLPALDVSLSVAIKAGVRTFKAAGMSAAYTGQPDGATAGEGATTYDLHGEMVATEVLEALARNEAPGGADQGRT